MKKIYFVDFKVYKFKKTQCLRDLILISFKEWVVVPIVLLVEEFRIVDAGASVHLIDFADLLGCELNFSRGHVLSKSLNLRRLDEGY